MPAQQRKYRPGAILLALLMFTTSVGIPMDMHFCGGQLKSVAFFGKAKRCYELAVPTKGCQRHQAQAQAQPGPTLARKKCCEDKTAFLELDQNQEISPAAQLSVSQQLLLTAYLTVNLLSPTTASNEVPFHHYKPPLPPRDIPVWVQSFRL
jgi:hypothetical protein